MSSLDPRLQLTLLPAPACPPWCTDEDDEHRGAWNVAVRDDGAVVSIDKTCAHLVGQVHGTTPMEPSTVDVSVERIATYGDYRLDDVRWVGLDGAYLTADEAEQVAHHLLEAARQLRE